jgi:hypothetical protein
LGTEGAASFGLTDFGAAPVLSSPLLEELELLPVLDFPQSQESDFELSSSVLSVSSHPDDDEVLLEDEEEVEEDDELEDDDEVLEDEEDDDEDDELVDDDEVDESEPQLSPLVSLVVGSSVPVDEVLPQPSSATGASSPVSS